MRKLLSKLKAFFRKLFAPGFLFVAGAVGSKIVSLLTGALATVLIVYSGYVLYHTFYTQNQAFNASWDVQQYKPPIIADETESNPDLSSVNPDYRAWLTMYGTNIDHPVVQGPDELYYASHDVFGEVSLSGSIYLSAGNTPDLSDQYNLIYGHHMDNGAMFGGLDEYLDEDYILAHKTGMLISPDTRYPLEVFAVILTDAYESQIYTTGPQRTVDEILYFLTHPTDNTTVTYYDANAASQAWKITALSTCASASTNGRLVVLCMTPESAAITPVPTMGPTAPPELDPTPPVDEPSGLTPVTEIEDVSFFDPAGQGRNVWAIVNLICVLLTAYMLFPVLHLKDKYGRTKLMRKANELAAAEDAAAPEAYAKLQKFRRRFRVGIGGGTVSLVAAIVAFILTENMKLPMVLIDRWTPLMVLILLIAWLIDVRMTRYREKPDDEMKQE